MLAAGLGPPRRFDQGIALASFSRPEFSSGISTRDIFSVGLVGAWGPGSSNKRFRSRLRAI